jgi:NADH dehydrogenase [ubiquinone] 1 alpha subcomplex assembly factor 6
MADTDEPSAAALKRFDRDRYLATLFAPASARPALWALYAFNSEVARVREQVREPIAGRIRLQWWRDVIAAIYDGAAPEVPLARALARAVAAHGLSREPFARLIEARESDLEEEPPADLAALVAYAEDSSSSLVTLALEVLGVREGVAHEAGRRVGIAWALSGLLRAAPHRARAGRIDFPAALLREHGIAAGRIDPRHTPPGLAAVARRIADVAQANLAEARRLAPDVPRAALPALLPATLAAHDLERLARAGHDPFAPGLVRPERVSRALRLALAAWRGRY